MVVYDFSVGARVAGAFHSRTVSKHETEVVLGNGKQASGIHMQTRRHRKNRVVWKTDGPVWRKCIEHLAEAARLNRLAAGEQIEMAKPDIQALWRKRADLAEGVVAARALTIGDAFVKAVITAGLTDGRRGRSCRDAAMHRGVRPRARRGRR